MAKYYDPVMCMVVDEPVRTCDTISAESPESMVRKLKLKGYEVDPSDKSMKTKYITLYKNGNKYDAEITRYSNGDLEIQEHKIHAVDSNPTIDKAIRNCDVNKAEGFKIYNAYVRNDTLYIEYEDLLYGNGKKEKESFTRTGAKKLLTDPWNTWLGTSKMVVKQFAG